MLNKGFSAREGHPATGMAKEDLVSPDLLHDGVGVHLLTCQLQGPFWTRGHTFAAEGANGGIKISTCRVEPLGTDSPAGMAPLALVGVIGKLLVLGPALRVRAPLTSQAATSQKNGGSYPLTIMDGIVLHLQDRAFGAIHCLVSSCHGPNAR